MGRSARQSSGRRGATRLANEFYSTPPGNSTPSGPRVAGKPSSPSVPPSGISESARSSGTAYNVPDSAAAAPVPSSFAVDNRPRGYQKRFPGRMLSPPIRGAMLPQSRPRLRTTCRLPLPLPRSRERPYRPRLRRGDHTARRHRLPRRLSRERMRRPGLLPRGHTMYLLPLPLRHSLKRPYHLRLRRGDPTAFRHPLPQPRFRERTQRPGLLPRGHTMYPLPLPPRPSRERVRVPRCSRRGHTTCRHRLRPGQSGFRAIRRARAGSHYAFPYVAPLHRHEPAPIATPAFGADIPFATPACSIGFRAAFLLPSYEIPGINIGGSAGTGALPVPGAGVAGVGEPSFYFLDGRPRLVAGHGHPTIPGNACIGGAPPI